MSAGVPIDTTGSPFFEGLAEIGASSAESILTDISPPVFDDEDHDLEIALTLAAKEAEEASTVLTPLLPPPPPPATPPPPSPLPGVSDNDVAKAKQVFIGIMPCPPSATSSATRGRSTSQKRPNAAAAQGKRSLAQKKARLASEPGKPRQSRLDGKYFKEYALNAGRLLANGVSQDDQFVLEKGLGDMDVLKMQKEKLAEIAASRGVFIAPKPIDVKKGGQAK